jgi:hypothetical protein
LRILWLVAVVAAAVAAPAGSGGPAVCASAALAPQVGTNGASGRIYVYATLWNRSRGSCTARGKVVVRLVDAKTRHLLKILGNPHIADIKRTLRVGRNAIVTLEWENYCGPGRPMLLEVLYGKRRDAERSNYPGARCDSPGVPSRLRLFHPPKQPTRADG